jgi:hypothetical protein
MNVSRSEVVTNMRANFNRNTLLMMSRAVCNCAEESQLPSLVAPFFVPFPPLPLPTVDEADFSAAFVSTAAMIHCSKKPYTSSNCLW